MKTTMSFDFCEDNEEMDEDEDFGIAPHY